MKTCSDILQGIKDGRSALVWMHQKADRPPPPQPTAHTHTNTHPLSRFQHANKLLLLSISCAKCLINPWLCKGGFLLLSVNLQVNLVTFYYVTEAAEDLWSIHKRPPETAPIAAPAFLISSYTAVKWAPDFYVRSFNTRLDQRNRQPVWLTDLCVLNTGTSLAFRRFWIITVKNLQFLCCFFFQRTMCLDVFSVQSKVWDC